MPKIIIFPTGLTLDANPGDNLMHCLLKHNVKIEHACEGSGTCATCHVYVRQGALSLNDIGDTEDETLSRAWGLDIDSRLSCQVTIGNEDLTIEIPKYTVNQVGER